MTIRTMSFVVAFVAILAFAISASAQDNPSWGVQASFTPSWQTLPALESGSFGASDEPWDAQSPVDPNLKALLTQVLGSWFGAGTDISGSDYSVGIARGKIDGGEWGVSYVRRNLDGSSRIEDLSTQCFGPSGKACFPRGGTYELRSVHMDGVEVYKFLPFVSRGRAQLGVTFAGGLAKMGGSVTAHMLNPVQVPSTATVAVEPGHTVREMAAAEMLGNIDISSIFPLARAEATVALRVTPRLKVRAGGGFNFPGTAINVGATYLF